MTSAIATSYKVEAFKGVHLDTDTYKILLIKPSPTGAYNAGNTNVGTPGSGSPSSSNVGTDEASGTGYSSGGKALTGFASTSSGTTAFIDFDDVTWTASSISAIGAIIYNSSRSNKIVAVIDFGGTITDTNGTFQIQMPTPDASNAIVRWA